MKVKSLASTTFIYFVSISAVNAACINNSSRSITLNSKYHREYQPTNRNIIDNEIKIPSRTKFLNVSYVLPDTMSENSSVLLKIEHSYDVNSSVKPPETVKWKTYRGNCRINNKLSTGEVDHENYDLYHQNALLKTPDKLAGFHKCSGLDVNKNKIYSDERRFLPQFRFGKEKRYNDNDGAGVFFADLIKKGAVFVGGAGRATEGVSTPSVAGERIFLKKERQVINGVLDIKKKTKKSCVTFKLIKIPNNTKETIISVLDLFDPANKRDSGYGAHLIKVIYN